jgi:hypothetical protein
VTATWMMQSPSKLNLDGSALFLDASAVINLVASNQMEEILLALACPILIEETVCGEFKRNPRDGSSSKGVIEALVARSRLTVVKMSDVQFEMFLRLTGCPPPDDLGDGEAATLACADGAGAAIIDEKKAMRIAVRDFSKMSVYSSLDLICSETVSNRLGRSGVSDAVYEALKVARMRVPHHWRNWIRDLLGQDRATELVFLK